MYYDDILYDDAAIVRLIDLVGATQVIAGTDYPFVIMDQDPVGRIERLAVDASVREALMRGNALRWLGRTAGAPA
jgi:aminocarboxymuconate-semialdehyde decarboxylase